MPTSKAQNCSFYDYHILLLLEIALRVEDSSSSSSSSSLCARKSGLSSAPAIIYRAPLRSLVLADALMNRDVAYGGGIRPFNAKQSCDTTAEASAPGIAWQGAMPSEYTSKLPFPVHFDLLQLISRAPQRQKGFSCLEPKPVIPLGLFLFGEAPETLLHKRPGKSGIVSE